MLKDKIAVVTGGAKGIGRYIAHGFAREGAKVAIGDIDLERLKRTEAELREIGADPLALKLDVRDEDDVRAFMKEIAARFGAIDVLFNNAGIVTHFGWGVPRWPMGRGLGQKFWGKDLGTNISGTLACQKQ